MRPESAADSGVRFIGGREITTITLRPVLFPLLRSASDPLPLSITPFLVPCRGSRAPGAGTAWLDCDLLHLIQGNLL